MTWTWSELSLHVREKELPDGGERTKPDLLVFAMNARSKNNEVCVSEHRNAGL